MSSNKQMEFNQDEDSFVSESVEGVEEENPRIGSNVRKYRTTENWNILNAALPTIKKYDSKESKRIGSQGQLNSESDEKQSQTSSRYYNYNFKYGIPGS